MAKLFINKDIAADADKMRYWLSGDDCVSFSDIQGFLSWMDPSDNSIEVELHSCGGDCIEGYAIYDALRASGKEISCTVVGLCASMATVILLAAPIERRKMYQHAQLLIHEPYCPKGAFNEDLTIGSLQEKMNFLNQERNKMLSLYVERTGKEQEEIIEAQMIAGSWFGSDKAVELGFISSVMPAMSAKVEKPVINNQTIKTEMKEKEEKKPTVAEAFRMLGVALGISKPEASGMVITTSTGEELTVEREEGEIQVGDTASPDGEFVLEDGRTVVVTDGVITEIKEPGSGGEDVEALQSRIEELERQVSDLTANAKSEDEIRILSMVEKAGGESWLRKAAASHYTPPLRSTQVGNKKPDSNISTSSSKIDRMLAEKREKFKQRYNK